MALAATGKWVRGCGGTSRYLCACAPRKSGTSDGNNNKNTYLITRKHFPLLLVQNVNFHQHSIIQFHIQSTHGILLEALQKARISASERELQIPEEFKRLKAGSLKWLFQSWPLPKAAFSALAQFESAWSAKTAKKGKPESYKGTPNETSTSKQKTLSEERLHAVLDFLRSKNLAIRRLVKLPWLLTSKPAVLEEAVKRVKKTLNLNDFGVAISFVNVSSTKLKDAGALWKFEAAKFQKDHEENGSPPFENRIDFLTFRLQCDREDVSDMMAKVNNLMTMPLEQITSILNFLLEAGVKPESIISDPWVFLHNVNFMQERLSQMKARGVTDFKPWVLRSPRLAYERFVKSEVEEKQLLGDHQNIKGFLEEKLCCDKQVASRILRKVPSIKTASATKLNEMIEFLFSEGFTTEHIQETPRILAHRVETISSRLSQVCQWQEKESVSLALLCRTSRSFEHLLQQMQKRTADSSDSAEGQPPISTST